MESFYLVIIFILFILAISDLIVGVSNDAVNFLSSAVGSKAASVKTIMIIAAIGVFVGAIMSNGMMEIARKGIFNPQFFYFSEVMVIFLTVMITDVVILDLFNTFGMPTSTTVSLIFELLGASVGIALIKIANSTEGLTLGHYINSEKALAIIGGILFSVVVAFVIGSLVQYLARMLFTFNYEKNMKYFSGIFGGVAITSILYFMLIKGLKQASFMSVASQHWIEDNTLFILISSLIVFSITLQLLYSLFKVNVLKIVVLSGTFALALAFAGNDLVNFIGVPLAGLESYRDFIANPSADPNGMLMTSLTEAVKTEWYLLMLAGTIMVITLATSKKAKSVMQTSLNLSRQNEGDERFESSILARSIVRGSRIMADRFTKFVPQSIEKKINRRFDKKQMDMEQGASFDLIRASVNLIVAGTLIAIGTAYKLPLSTTYVTFMVAMGSSLSDKAWGRESAVYRITGVMSVIGGWFFTALVAFTIAFIIANIIYFGKIYAIVLLVVLSFYLIFKTRKMFNEKQEREAEVIEEEQTEMNQVQLLRKKITQNVVRTCSQVAVLYGETTTAFSVENRRKLRDIQDDIVALKSTTKSLKKDFTKAIRQMEEQDVDDIGVYYFQCVDFTTETVYVLEYLNRPLYEHIDNNFKPLLPEQKEELAELSLKVKKMISDIVSAIEKGNFNEFDNLHETKQELISEIAKLEKRQLKRIKIEHSSTKIGMIYLTILIETINMLKELGNLLKTYRKFMGKK